ncbi:MAG TPA: hypothetical protein VFT98_22015 [Myxococcota bacterium]|nr:hypothetical protein [Myxococcota bacterium]
MAGSQYCQPDDLYRYAVPPGSFPNPGRLVAAVDTATDILTLDGHGLRADAEILFRAEAGGSLPAPLVAGTTYYAIVLTDATFKVAATAGGAAINLTTAGVNVIMIAELPFVEKIEMASAEVDELTGHPTPLDPPYPVSVIAYTAMRAADLMLLHTGQAPSVLGEEQRAIMREQRAAWRKGIPIRGAVVPPSANLAVTGSASSSDPRGWGGADGSIP